MTEKTLAVIVLAAGQGTRMKSATPKLLHPLAGAPVLAHVLDAARALGAARQIVVVRHERDRVAAVASAEVPDAVIVDQDEVPGTGRAVEQAVAALPDDFEGEVLVVNGDVPLLDAGTLSVLIEHHRRARAGATVLSTILDDASGYGRIIRDADGSFARIVEHKDASEAERAATEINSGVYVFTATALRQSLPKLTTDNAQGEKYITDVIGILRAAGSPVAAVAAAEAWRVEGINDRQQLSVAAARLNAEIIRHWQLSGVTVQDPGSTWIDRTVSIGRDATIKPGTQLLGATTIADDAVIGPDTTLQDCEVGAGATIRRSDATLAVVGAGATVGPFSYLRPGTVLGADGKIGTFSETKNAVIGAGSKLAHFNYVGDAEIGEMSNIGAGAITANYDGENKHRTIIGSHVRVGTQTVFVAPVRMGDGAYTGAGAVVRKDIPAGALGVAVAPQRNLSGWVEQNRPGSAAAQAAEAAESSAATPGEDK